MATKKQEPDYLNAINRLLMEESNQGLQEGDFTIEMFHDEYKKKFGAVSHPQLYRILEKRIKAGLMMRRRGVVNGRSSNIYRFIK